MSNTICKPLFPLSLMISCGVALACHQGVPIANMGPAMCTGGQAGIFSCNNIDLLANIDDDTLGDTEIGSNDLWGWKDELNDRYYAIIGLRNATAFVDITDPENPVNLGTLPSETGTSTWRDIKTHNNHAYIVSDNNGNHGMQVFDLTRLRSVATPPVIFTPDFVYGDVGSAHNIVINEDSGFAYIVDGDGCSNNLQVLDLSSPQSPTLAACFDYAGATHDTQCVNYTGPDADYAGAEVCFDSNIFAGLGIVDVTDKNNISTISVTSYPDLAVPHQGWLTEDHRYFLMGDEGDENPATTRTYIWDLLDLDNPQLVGAHVHTTPAIDHNLYISGDFVYQANYSAGLRILQLSDLPNAQLEEVAFFDTYPEDDNPTFCGAWSVYPFFDNGVLIVSDIRYGLFVLRARGTEEIIIADGFEAINN